MTNNVKQKVRSGDVWLCHDITDGNHQFIAFVNDEGQLQTIEPNGASYPLIESYWSCLTIRIVKGKGNPFKPEVNAALAED